MNKLSFSKLNYDTLKIADKTVLNLIMNDSGSNIIINFSYGCYYFKGPIKFVKSWLEDLKAIVDKKAEAKKNNK